MASDWNHTTLGSIATDDGYGLVDGPFGSNLPASCYTPEGIPVIRGSNLSLGLSRFRSEEFVYVSHETAKRLQRSLCKPLDIVFTKKGTLGQTGIIPEAGVSDLYLLSSNQMKLTVNRRVADPLFVYYYVSSTESVHKIIQDSESTGVPKTNVTYLRDFPITLPPLPEQRAIAHILGTLDDKIELNRRMNETLEGIAQAMFKSWFVDFDPVRAKAEGRQPVGMDADTAALFPDSFEESELGLIPKGWTVSGLGTIGNSVGRSVGPRAFGANTPYVGLDHVPRQSLALYDWGSVGEVVSGKSTFTRGDILFGKLRPYFHKVVVAPFDGLCSTDILVLKPKKTDWTSFFTMHVSSSDLVAYTDSRSTGTRMPRTNWKDMAAYQVALPPNKLAQHFNNIASPTIDRIVGAVFETKTLGAIRDTLLPKLISGELRVLDAENLLAESPI